MCSHSNGKQLGQAVNTKFAISGAGSPLGPFKVQKALFVLMNEWRVGMGIL